MDADSASRIVTLDELKARPRTDLLDQDVYNDLPGKTALKDAIVDAVAGIAALFRVSQPLIQKVAPDMEHYWDPDSEYGTNVRFPMIQPLKDAMDGGDDIVVIAHSLGAMISYDTFWKFCRIGEYRPNYTDKKIDLFITIGSPLADETVKRNLKGAHLRDGRKYPSNISRWVPSKSTWGVPNHIFWHSLN